MEQIFAIEQDRDESDAEGAGDVNKEGSEREAAGVAGVFVYASGDEETGQRTKSAAAENEEVSK